MGCVIAALLLVVKIFRFLLLIAAFYFTAMAAEGDIGVSGVVGMWVLVFLVWVVPPLMRRRKEKKQLRELEETMISAQVKAAKIVEEERAAATVGTRGGAWVHCKNCDDNGFCMMWGSHCADLDCNIKAEITEKRQNTEGTMK